MITGAGQGIGRAYALSFAEAGAIPVIAEIDSAKGDAVAAEITAAGGQALSIQTDVTDPASVKAAVSSALDRFVRIDVLINNAAIFVTLGRQPFWEIDLEEWRAVMDVNITGCFICASAVSGVMRHA